MPYYFLEKLEPKNGRGFPLLEDAYIEGGFRVVETLSERDSYLNDTDKKQCLKKGCVFAVQSNEKWYKYNGNNGWDEINFQPVTTTNLEGYTFDQEEPSKIWRIEHNKDTKYFTCEVMVGNQKVIVDTVVIDSNTIEIQFPYPVSGYVSIIFIKK